MNSERPEISDWLPTTRKELKKRGIDQLDVIIISGDAYVDHPSFGHAVIARIIEHAGFSVGIVAQPNWRDDLRDFKKLGKPRLFFGVTSGCMDSMVCNYTSRKRLRSDDAYTPGGEAGRRPDNAVTVYTKILKKIFPETPVVIGGIEASLRRFVHYDYWIDSLKPSILETSNADLLVYGMGEKPLTMLLQLLKKGVSFSSIKTIPQTAFFLSKDLVLPSNKKWNDLEMESFDDCIKSKKAFALNFCTIERNLNNSSDKRLIQGHENGVLVVNPPFRNMTEKELDASFDLPYTRLPHPKYKKRGAIPAFEMIKFSINSHRGCFGGCGFCAISFHQGRRVVSRTRKSILREVENIIKKPDFKGHLTDLGGPSANMYGMKRNDESLCLKCQRGSCLVPHVCENLNCDHGTLLEIIREISNNKKVKKLTIGSGIRYDLFTEANKGNEYAKTVIENHVSGRLKVAPEHTSGQVLKRMRKQSFDLFLNFNKLFERTSLRKGLKQDIVPYFISGLPGCRTSDMIELKEIVDRLGYRLKQVQDFMPAPMTLATTMYYTEFDPYTLEKIYVAKSNDEKMKQWKLFL